MSITVFIEIPKGSSQKYEFDEEEKTIKLDRTLYGPMYFPFEYGFIKGTKGEDGDPLDCVLLTSFPTFPGCLVDAEPIGLLEMEDEGGIDTKIIAVPKAKIDPRFEEIKDVSDLPEHTKKEIKEFFENYKNLEPGKWVKLKDFKSKSEAEKVIEKSLLK
ncbi:MAG TPA: inorganic diphosphatase [Candidatus Pacearchaeota archaeon]|nr:inorganic diphosphatase [Candidatus Pacearchaeota archaeon]HOK93960.1 inorganic diphosphatase [Candidatus Pacearchaeota archaeon]HPO75031.1 inorganic diphosphatase [Candidatus Pacearchaeota archaeon]